MGDTAPLLTKQDWSK